MDPNKEMDDFAAPKEAGDVQSVDKVTCDDDYSCTTVNPVLTTVAPSGEGETDEESALEKHMTTIVTTIICVGLAVLIIIALEAWRRKKRAWTKHASSRPLPVSSSDAATGLSSVFENDPDDPGVEDSVSLTSSLELQKAAQEKQELDNNRDRVLVTQRVRHPAGTDKKGNTATGGAAGLTVEMHEIQPEKEAGVPEEKAEAKVSEEKEKADVSEEKIIVTRL